MTTRQASAGDARFSVMGEITVTTVLDFRKLPLPLSKSARIVPRGSV
jgi:hypothetical protein